ncbi:hypothetical protein [Haloferula sp. A504]|uniref:8-oxoguanine DNA glycosylase OGG fold protein n=1 Tax=Haloferula sp. A504 TaxID=3373601 RepID=UPI0031BF80D2|nr:hypothetical protein [Verrucomicrobiaceae bacterium E54]
MFQVHPEHLAKLKEYFPKAPTQLAVGDSPRSYCQRLEDITDATLVWPKEITDDALSRDGLGKLCRKPSTDDLVCYAATMAWGGRGVDSPNYRMSLEGKSFAALKGAISSLRSSTSSRQAAFEDFQSAAWNIKGLKVSFYTKLLFFLRRNRKGDKPAYILDQFTAKSAYLLFPDNRPEKFLTTGGFPRPDLHSEDYEWFCQALEDLGKQLKWTGEQVEMALFDGRGGDWRNYIQSFFLARSNRRRAPKKRTNAVPAAKGAKHGLATTVAAEHIRSYAGGLELPTPNASVNASAKVNCGNLNELNWHYVVVGDEVRAAVFIPSGQIRRYNALRKRLGITGHNFGGGIVGTGSKGGKSCTLSISTQGGYTTDPSAWPGIANLAVRRMHDLFTTVAEII